MRTAITVLGVSVLMIAVGCSSETTEDSADDSNAAITREVKAPFNAGVEEFQEKYKGKTFALQYRRLFTGGTRQDKPDQDKSYAKNDLSIYPWCRLTAKYTENDRLTEDGASYRVKSAKAETEEVEREAVYVNHQYLGAGKTKTMTVSLQEKNDKGAWVDSSEWIECRVITDADRPGAIPKLTPESFMSGLENSDMQWQQD